MDGSIIYLTTTRADIVFALSLISKFMESLKSAHWQEWKRIPRYIVGTKKFGIQYTWNSYFKLMEYTDSDFVGSIDDRKSTSGYVFSLGLGAVAWYSK